MYMSRGDTLEKTETINSIIEEKLNNKVKSILLILNLSISSKKRGKKSL